MRKGTTGTGVKRIFIAIALVGVVAGIAGYPAAADALSLKWLDARDGLPQARITSLLAAGGRIIAGFEGRGIAVLGPGNARFRFVTRADGLPSDDVKSLVLYKGQVHAGTAEGIAVEEGKRWTVLREAAGIPLRNVVLSASPDGKELWACSLFLAGGTVVFDGKGWTFIGGEGKGLFNSISSFGFSPGAVLLGSGMGMVYERKGKEIEPLRERFPEANVTSVAERGGVVYTGTNRGLYLWRGKEWQPASVPAGFAGEAVFAILKSEIDLIVAGIRGVFLLDRAGEMRVLTGSEQFLGGPVYALAEDGGTLYAATERGVAVMKDWRER